MTALAGQRRFARIDRLPPYVFNITAELRMAARRRGEDIIDMSMGNPDGATPAHIVAKLAEVAARPDTHAAAHDNGNFADVGSAVHLCVERAGWRQRGGLCRCGGKQARGRGCRRPQGRRSVDRESLRAALVDSFPWLSVTDITDDLDATAHQALDVWNATPIARVAVEAAA